MTRGVPLDGRGRIRASVGAMLFIAMSDLVTVLVVIGSIPKRISLAVFIWRS